MNANLDGLGDHLRGAREQRGMSQRELARRLDLSASLISLIEGGKSQPSVGTLWAIVSELGLSLDEVFGNDESAMEGIAASEADGVHMVRPDDREVINLQTGVRWELLTHEQEKDVDFVYAVYEVGGASTPDGSLMPHRGREYGYVISGKLGIDLGSEQYELSAGSSIVYDSTRPHRLFNTGAVPVHAIWIVMRDPIES